MGFQLFSLRFLLVLVVVFVLSGAGNLKSFSAPENRRPLLFERSFYFRFPPVVPTWFDANFFVSYWTVRWSFC